MTDRIFFPSALLVAILMVAIAVLPGMNAVPTGPVSGGNTDYRRIEVSGAQLNRFVAGGDVDISVERVDGQPALRIEVEAGALADDPLRGPHFVLDRDLETVFAGREIQVTVRARAADRFGAEQMRVNYSVGAAIESGWQTFTMTREFTDNSFIWTPPPRAEGTDAGYDYLGIRPVAPEKQRAIYVQSVTFQPMD